MEPAPFTATSGLSPNVVRFAPDGKKLLLWVKASEDVIRLIFPEQQQAETRVLFKGQLSGALGGASWMPDSRHVIIGVGRALWLGDTETDTLRQLTVGTTSAMSPSVSPDGTRIIFSDVISDFNVVEPPTEQLPPRILVGTSQYDGSATWTPVTGRLAYVTARAGSEEIWVRSDADLDSDRRLLGPAELGTTYDHIRDLTFSPEGEWLAFTAYTNKPFRMRLGVMPGAGGNARLITPEHALVGQLSSSVDTQNRPSIDT